MYVFFRSRNYDVVEQPAFPSESNVGRTYPPRSPGVEMMVPSPSPTMQQTRVTGVSFQPTQASSEQETGDLFTMKPSHSPVPVADTAPTNMTPTTVPTRVPSSRPTVFPTAGTPAPTINTPLPSKAPTEAATDELKAILLQASPDSFESLQDVSSPQYQALDWLLEDPFYSTYSGARVVQRWAMSTFYYSTEGDQWDESGNWLSDMNECSWFSKGKVCDRNGNVKSIDLKSNNLAGTLPGELSLFSNSLGTSIRTENTSTQMTSRFFSPSLYRQFVFFSTRTRSQVLYRPILAD
jgi:hypothetical protein